jgi:Putative esterase
VVNVAKVIRSARQQPDGTLTHTVTSPYQAGEVAIHVLLPDSPDRNPKVLYLLPVEPHDGDQCGEPLSEVGKHDLHNRHQLICVKPTFSHPPWYADHPSGKQIRQESYFLNVVVPFIDETYCESEPTRLLLGFSKSGWGAFSLLLRHPDLFAKAAAFDAPLAWETPNRYGMGEVFGTQANMDRYCVVELINRSAEAFAGEPRLGLYGYSDFRGHHQFLHYHMLKLGIPHEYRDGPRREHRWDSGWVPEAVDFLVR